MSVLVFTEHDADGAAGASLEALTLAATLPDARVEAVTAGRPGLHAAAQLAAYGADRVHALEGELLDDYAPEAWGSALAQLVRATGPAALLAPGSDRGNEVMAHAAARLDLPLATNCTALAPADGLAGDWQLTRVRWGGILLEDAELAAATKLATVAPHTVSLEERPPADTPDVTPFVAEVDPGLARSRVRERTTEAEGVSLATAPVVVAGGRGVGSAEGFEVLEQLAEKLGGAVGCSRVATNNGWRPHADQVGQTGTRVAPDLYIACGISGATQHWVGCMSSKRILAINTDAEAPMVTRADYAVIGDVHEVLPEVVARLRSRTAAPV